MQERRHRQLNVQQQNLAVEQSIRREAAHWRAHAIPEALRAYGQGRGIEWERAIIIDLDIDFPGMPQLFGVLLTQDERFIKFALDTDASHTALDSVSEWNDVTHKQDLGEHNPGTGMGKGALALKVLHGLNGDPAIGGEAPR